MSHLPRQPHSNLRPDLRYTRAPVPLHFPEAAEVPQNKTQLTLRTFLYQLLKFALGPSHSVGSEQFVYFNAADPKKCLAPDAFVKLDVPDTQFGTWKTLERGGPPNLAVEMVGPNEDAEKDLASTLVGFLAHLEPESTRTRFRTLGVNVGRIFAGSSRHTWHAPVCRADRPERGLRS